MKTHGRDVRLDGLPAPPVLLRFAPVQMVRGRDLALFGGCVRFPASLRPGGTRGCCSGCRACSCYGTPTGSSSRCCSSRRRGSRGSSLLRTKPQILQNPLPEFQTAGSAHKRQQGSHAPSGFLFRPLPGLIVVVVPPQFIAEAITAAFG